MLNSGIRFTLHFGLFIMIFLFQFLNVDVNKVTFQKKILNPILKLIDYYMK